MENHLGLSEGDLISYWRGDLTGEVTVNRGSTLYSISCKLCNILLYYYVVVLLLFYYYYFCFMIYGN